MSKIQIILKGGDLARAAQAVVGGGLNWDTRSTNIFDLSEKLQQLAIALEDYNREVLKNVKR